MRNRDLFFKKIIILLLITFPLIVLDQASKLWVDHNLILSQSIEIIKNIFHITSIRNTGVAFGIFSGIDSLYLQNIFIIITFVAIGFIVFFYWKLESEQCWLSIGTACIMGGAIGNLIDRIRLGGVIDFIDIHYYSHHWPAFNVADSFITIGAFIFGASILLKKY